MIIRVDVVLVHPGDAEEAKSCVVELEAKLKAENRVKDCKDGTIEEYEGGHCAMVVPVWGV